MPIRYQYLVKAIPLVFAASAHEAGQLGEIAQLLPTRQVQYQSWAGPVFVPAPAPPAAPELTPPVYPSRLTGRPPRAPYQQAVAWHPDTPLTVVPLPPVAPVRLSGAPPRAAYQQAFAWAVDTPAPAPPAPDVKATGDTGVCFPDRAWQYQQVSAPVFVDVEPPAPEVIPATGPIEAALGWRTQQVQYQASAGPVRFIPVPPLTPPVYPARLDRRPARAAYVQAFTAQPLTPPTYPLDSAGAVFPDRLERRYRLPQHPATVRPILVEAPPIAPPVFPPSVPRETLTGGTVAVGPLYVPDVTAVAPGLTPPLFPNRLVGRVPRAPYQLAFWWNSDTPATPPVPFADAHYPDTLPALEARGAYQQAYAAPVSVQDVTGVVPELVLPVYPRRLDRPNAAPFTELFVVAPIYVADVTAVVPALTPPVYPSRLEPLYTRPVHPAEAHPPWEVVEPDVFTDQPFVWFPEPGPRRRPQHLAVAVPPVAPDAYPPGSATAVYPARLDRARRPQHQALAWSTVTPPDITPGELFFFAGYPRRLERRPPANLGYVVGPVYVPDVTAVVPPLQPPPVYPRWLTRAVATHRHVGFLPGQPPTTVVPILPPDEVVNPEEACVTSPPSAGAWNPCPTEPPFVTPNVGATIATTQARRRRRRRR